MTGKIILFTGGIRSGKSKHSEQMAMELSPTPKYVATARILDNEMKKRVALHQSRRGDNWILSEADVDIASAINDGDVALVDCVTMWITNLFFDYKCNADSAIQFIEKSLDRITKKDATVIFVTNEIGLGGVNPDPMTRCFTDLHGKVNAMIAELSQSVYMSISGIKVKIK
ncbi:MAG: bifunctional adenosylcobinamide kinase/adenosylcobinamide-phosphate guanylyltransferase [Lachnoclostridium sp.]|nr:bifunctional adenosylcobinamide kinase/adenosylcobinamide-phosphate guanylyltransferase [Lachnoclostridium sp.]